MEHAPAACQQVLRPVSPKAATGTNEEPAVVAGHPDGDAVGAPSLAPVGRDLDLALPGRSFNHVLTELGHRRPGIAPPHVLFASGKGARLCPRLSRRSAQPAMLVAE